MAVVGCVSIAVDTRKVSVLLCSEDSRSSALPIVREAELRFFLFAFDASWLLEI